MQGARGQIRTGGDIGARIDRLAADAGAARALFRHRHGRRDGTAQVSFDIPAFAGTVRVMAVAWSKDKVGKASGDVIVRDPVVLTATLPRFLRTGDRGAVQLELDNVEGAAGDYSIAVEQRRHRQARRRQAVTLKLAAKQRDHRLGAGVGRRGRAPARSRSASAGPNGFALERSYALDVRPANADPDAPHRARACPRRDADAVEGHVRRFRAGHRARRPVGRGLDLARRRDAAERARPLSVRLFRADHQPRGGDALHQRAGRAGQARARRRHRCSASRTPSSVCWRGRTRTARSACGRSAATIPGSTPTSPIS